MPLCSAYHAATLAQHLDGAAQAKQAGYEPIALGVYGFLQDDGTAAKMSLLEAVQSLRFAAVYAKDSGPKLLLQPHRDWYITHAFVPLHIDPRTPLELQEEQLTPYAPLSGKQYEPWLVAAHRLADHGGLARALIVTVWREVLGSWLGGTPLPLHHTARQLGADAAAFEQRADQERAAGRYPRSVALYGPSDDLRFACVWAHPVDGPVHWSYDLALRTLRPEGYGPGDPLREDVDATFSEHYSAMVQGRCRAALVVPVPGSEGIVSAGQPLPAPPATDWQLGASVDRPKATYFVLWRDDALAGFPREGVALVDSTEDGYQANVDELGQPGGAPSNGSDEWQPPIGDPGQWPWPALAPVSIGFSTTGAEESSGAPRHTAAAVFAATHDRRERWWSWHGQQPPQKLVVFDDMLENALRANGARHAQMAIVRHGRLVYARPATWSEHASDHEVTPAHRMCLASLSKPVTAMAVLKLYENYRLGMGPPWLRLDLDMKLGDALDLAGLKGLDGKTVWESSSAMANVTVRQLLVHAGGFRRDFRHWDEMIDQLDAHGYAKPLLPVSLRQFVQYAITNPSAVFVPGNVGRESYSNIGYMVLGFAIEAVTHMSYPDAVQAFVLGPLGIPARPPAPWFMGVPTVKRTREADDRHLEQDLYPANSRLTQPAYGRSLSAVDYARFMACCHLGGAPVFADPVSAALMWNGLWGVHGVHVFGGWRGTHDDAHNLVAAGITGSLDAPDVENPAAHLFFPSVRATWTTLDEPEVSYVLLVHGKHNEGREPIRKAIVDVPSWPTVDQFPAYGLPWLVPQAHPGAWKWAPAPPPGWAGAPPGPPGW
ncbi:MAG: beta-lactamase family protein [Deltaproteobacteria bacterium]|nr:beta-lactamase family protein [Deltaproteobacteria bacterium]